MRTEICNTTAKYICTWFTQILKRSAAVYVAIAAAAAVGHAVAVLLPFCQHEGRQFFHQRKPIITGVVREKQPPLQKDTLDVFVVLGCLKNALEIRGITIKDAYCCTVRPGGEVGSEML